MDENSSAISKIRRSREEAIDENDEVLIDEPMEEGVSMFMNPTTSQSVPFTSVSARRTTTQRHFFLPVRPKKRPIRSAILFANSDNGDDPEEEVDRSRGFFMNQQVSDPQLNAEYQRVKRENDELRAKAAKLEDHLANLQTRAKESYDEQVNKNVNDSKKKVRVIRNKIGLHVCVFVSLLARV
jgi:regulator of replication initiation timing